MRCTLLICACASCVANTRGDINVCCIQSKIPNTACVQHGHAEGLPSRTYTKHQLPAHLCICQVCDSISVCGNEQAAWVLPDAQCGVLDLVVVDVTVKANHHRTNLQTGNKARKAGGQ